MHDLELLLIAWKRYLEANPDRRGPHDLPDFRCGVQACADQLETALATMKANADG